MKNGIVRTVKLSLKSILIVLFLLNLSTGLSSCKAKKCPVLEDGQEGYKAKNSKKKKGRSEGLFSKDMRKRRP